MKKQPPKCCYCNNDAELKSYRDNGGCVGSEIVCGMCHQLSNETLSLKANWTMFEEGDDYWCIETVKGVTHLLNSCWDDQSQEINNKDIFKTFDDGLEYLYAIGKDVVRISNMYTNKVFDIKILDKL